MRLIEVDSILTDDQPIFKEIFESTDERYAILSHRWAEEELTYQEVANDEIFWDKLIVTRQGYVKLQKMAKIVRQYDIKWIWCDTCCIDKTNSTELTEAINSMYKWYQDSAICLAYLMDWPTPAVPAFTQSVWFERCWTLQELIAPEWVLFFDREWNGMGNKRDLAAQISARTGIDQRLLQEKVSLDNFSIAQRMSWAADRRAARSEDVAYSLLGIFEVSMAMLYGEGPRAFMRLQEEILRRSTDQSIFVWSAQEPSTSLLASSPADFAHSGEVHYTPHIRIPFTLNNLGLEIELELRQIGADTYAASLACDHGEDNDEVSLILELEPETPYLCRVKSRIDKPYERFSLSPRRTQKVTIIRNVMSKTLANSTAPFLYGFRLGDDCKSALLINDWNSTHYWNTGKWQADNRPSNASRYPVFQIPDGDASSVATMIFLLHDRPLFIQLMYDFDFRPCCCVTRCAKSSLKISELLRKTPGSNEERYTWLKSPLSNWEQGPPSQLEFNGNSLTGDMWAVKSTQRGDLSAAIPMRFTKSDTYHFVSFKRHHGSRDWIFELTVHEQVCELFKLPEFCIVSGEDDLRKVLREGLNPHA